MKITTISDQNDTDAEFSDVLAYKLGIWFPKEDIHLKNKSIIVTYKCHDYTICWIRETCVIDDSHWISWVKITSDTGAHADLQVIPQIGLDPDVEDISKVIHKLDDFTCGRIDKLDLLFADR